jgi:phosphoenolpyruvate synthase/pyruvate phosphate dikinase
MYVRAARFEGIDTANIDRDMEEFRKMLRTTEVPEGMSEETFAALRSGVKRVMSLVDREQGTSLDLMFTATAEDARRVHEALDSLTPPEGAGKRTSVGTYELLLDEQLG